MSEVVSWCGTNTTELVIIYVTDCEGTGCTTLTQQVLTQLNISFIADCTQLSGLTVSKAMARARLPTGGLALGIFGCVDEKYDPSIECYVANRGDSDVNAAAACCYDPKTQSLPFGKFWTYMNTTTATPQHLDTGELWMTQV